MERKDLCAVVDGLLLEKFGVYPNDVDRVVGETVYEVSKIVLTEWPEGRSNCPIRPLVIERANHLFHRGRLELRDTSDQCLGIGVIPERLRLVANNTRPE